MTRNENQLSGTSPVAIRLYQPRDRNAVRRLAYDTADAGRPSSFADPQLQMDLLTRYYTDHESGSTWIAEQNGNVVGYLTGCLDTHLFLRWMRWRGNALVVSRMLSRNLFQPALWKWLGARVQALREGGAHREEWVRPYPAHLHMNLAPEARGQGTGGKLLEKFIEQCRNAGAKGIHLPTRADNATAQHFFGRYGFKPVAAINSYRPSGNVREPVPVVIMGRSLFERGM